MRKLLGEYKKFELGGKDMTGSGKWKMGGKEIGLVHTVG